MEQLKAGFDDHEGRIKILEQNYSKLEGKISSIENGQLQLENTVLKTSQDQKDLLTKLIDHHLDLKKKQVEADSQAKAQEVDLKKTRIISRKELWIAVLGSGGLVTFITLAFNHFQ